MSTSNSRVETSPGGRTDEDLKATRPDGASMSSVRVIEMTASTGALSPSHPVKERETMGNDG